MKIKNFFRYIFVWILIAIGFVMYVNHFQTKPKDYILLDEDVYTEVDYTDGTHKEYSEDKFGLVNKNDIVTIHVPLPKTPYYSNATLAFYDYSTITEVWHNDNLLTSYGKDIAEKGSMIGNHSFVVPIPKDAWGNELQIVLKITENSAFSSFTSIKVYPSEDIAEFYIGNNPIGLIVSLTLLLSGVIGILGILISRIGGSEFRGGIYLFLTQILISIWMITNGNMYYLFGYSNYFWQPLEYIAGYGSSIPLLMFLKTMAQKEPTWEKVLSIAAHVSGIFWITAMVLNFTNIVHFDGLMYVGTVLLIMDCILFVGYIFSKKKEKDISTYLMKVSVIFFSITIVYEMMIRVLTKYIAAVNSDDYPSLISIGILLLFICLLGSFVTQFYQKQRALMKSLIEMNTLNDVLEATPTGICQIKSDGNDKVITANDMSYQILGYTKEELQLHKPDSPFDRLHESERAEFRKFVDEIVEKKTIKGEREFTTLDANQQRKIFLISYFYDLTGTGNITMNIIDITHRKQMEDNLQLSEQLSQLALSQSGKQFFRVDIPKRTMYLSEDSAKELRLPSVIENMPEEFVTRKLVIPESAQEYRAMFDRIYAGEPNGESIIGGYYIKNPNSVVWFKFTFKSIFDENQKPTYSIITCDDITEQYKAELDSKWNKASIERLAESKYTICTIDLTSNEFLEQTGKLFDRVPEIIKKYDRVVDFIATTLVHKDDIDEFRKFFQPKRLMEEYRNGQTSDYTEYQSLQSGVTFRWTNTTVSMVEAPYNNHVMMQILVVDIEDLKNGEEQKQIIPEELKRELEEKRIRVILKQMRPHFLYNTLSAIQAVTMYDAKYAYDLLYDFTIYLRSNMKALSTDKLIPFTEEMDNIHSYLNIEKMRFGDNMKIVTDLQCEDFYVVPLSVQHFVENAARHGLYPKDDEGGTLSIRSRETEDSYIVEVEDDGEGFDVEEMMRPDSPSVGIKDIIVRLKTLANAHVNITSTIGNGTLVQITIPKQKKETITE